MSTASANLVKICGLTDKDAVRAAVDAGAGAIGFVFARSVRQVTPQQAAGLAAGVPSSVLRVAVMLHPTRQQWRAVLDGFAPDVLQTDAGDFEALDVPETTACWPVLREGAFDDTAGLPGTYLYEGRASGSGEQVDWQRAARIAAGGRMILAGGLSAANVAEAIRTVRPWGVDVSSAVESAPGRKDPAKVAAFVRAAKDAFDAGIRASK